MKTALASAKKFLALARQPSPISSTPNLKCHSPYRDAHARELIIRRTNIAEVALDQKRINVMTFF